MASIERRINFTDQVREARRKIQESFKRSHEALRVRESNLLSRLEAIETEFNVQTIDMNNLLEELNQVKIFALDTLTENELNDTHGIIQTAIDAKIQNLSAKAYHSIEFDWDPLFDTDIEQLGNITLNGQSNISLARSFPPQVKPVIPDYNTKHIPIAFSCRKSTVQDVPGELNTPSGVAIHYRTGQLYVVDIGNNCVQVFSCNGDYLFMFNDKMNSPAGICISLDRVFVTQYNGHCVNIYEIGGRILSNIIGREGRGEGQFKCPHGIDVSERNHNVYVCDRDNNRVQIFTEDLDFHSILGVGLFECPYDVKTTRDRVLVLTCNDPCLLVFTSDHILINIIITRGVGKQTNNPYCFDIDRECNIIMSDYCNHCVYVFSQQGDLIHKFGEQGQGLGEFVCPYGIALDNRGRIIVVDQKKIASLQIF